MSGRGLPSVPGGFFLVVSVWDVLLTLASQRELDIFSVVNKLSLGSLQLLALASIIYVSVKLKNLGERSIII